MERRNVAYAPKLAYHLPSLRMAVAQGQTWVGDKQGITVKMESGKNHRWYRLYMRYGSRVGSESSMGLMWSSMGFHGTFRGVLWGSVEEIEPHGKFC